MFHTPRVRDIGNYLLDRLPDAEFESLAPTLQRVGLNLKQVVHQFEAEVNHVYFPTTAMISLLTVTEEDDPVEVATVGREGLVGLTTSLGVERSPHRAICVLKGESLRLPVRPYLEGAGPGPELSRLIRRYAAYSLRGAGQGIACNARHPVESRAGRWLLIAHDQAGRDEFPMTQEFWASMLGVRRQTVTGVAGALQRAGLIEFRRGVIVIRDRARLEEVACECYATNRAYYDRVFS